MNYKDYIKDELTKFRLILIKNGIEGDEWGRHMETKMRLLNGIFAFKSNPRWNEFCARVQPMIRVRDGKIVWHGAQRTDYLTRISIADLPYILTFKNPNILLTKIYHELQPFKKLKVYFPSNDAVIFKPSAEYVFLQLPQELSLRGLSFEIRFKSTDVSECYDHILQCHVATVLLYYYNNLKNIQASKDAFLKENLEELEVRKVHKVDKINEPEKPTKVIRTYPPSRSY